MPPLPAWHSFQISLIGAALVNASARLPVSNPKDTQAKPASALRRRLSSRYRNAAEKRRPIGTGANANGNSRRSKSGLRASGQQVTFQREYLKILKTLTHGIPSAQPGPAFWTHLK